MITFKKGIRHIPTTPTVIPIILYAVPYTLTKDAIFFSSFSANGLYKAYTIAPPIPNSANESIERILVNKPFIPK